MTFGSPREPAERRGDSWARRIVLFVIGAAVGLGAWYVDGGQLAPGEPGPESAVPALAAVQLTAAARYVSYFGLAFLVLRWWRLADPRRSSRFSFAPLLAAGFWGLLLTGILQMEPWHALVALVLTAAVVQLVSPWEPPPPPPAKRLRLRCA